MGKIPLEFFSEIGSSIMIALPDHAMQMTSRSKSQIPQGCRLHHCEEIGGNGLGVVGEAEVEMR